MPQLDTSIIIRPFKDIDFDEVVNLCVRKWCSDITGAYDRIIFGRVLTAGALQRSVYTMVAEENGSVIGVCFGGLSSNRSISQNSFWHRRFEDIMVIARDRARRGGVKVEDRLFSRLRSYTTADVFISLGYANSEAEINLLIVDPNHMGKGVGSRLFDDMTARFKDAGARGFFLIVSSESDIDFFGHRGLNCIQEKQGTSGDRGNSVIYLYGRRL